MTKKSNKSINLIFDKKCSWNLVMLDKNEMLKKVREDYTENPENTLMECSQSEILDYLNVTDSSDENKWAEIECLCKAKDNESFMQQIVLLKKFIAENIYVDVFFSNILDAGTLLSDMNNEFIFSMYYNSALSDGILSLKILCEIKMDVLDKLEDVLKIDL